MQDFRLAVRALRSTPIVSAVAILSLALGIGANTAMFSLVNSLLLRSLPVKNPRQLVILSDTSERGAGEYTYAIWDEIRQRPQLFDGAFTWSSARFNLSKGGQTEFVDGLWTSGRMFETLGVPAILGRTFSDADDRRGGGPDGPVAVVSYALLAAALRRRPARGRPDDRHRARAVHDHRRRAAVVLRPRGRAHLRRGAADWRRAVDSGEGNISRRPVDMVAGDHGAPEAGTIDRRGAGGTARRAAADPSRIIADQLDAEGSGLLPEGSVHAESGGHWRLDAPPSATSGR